MEVPEQLFLYYPSRKSSEPPRGSLSGAALCVPIKAENTIKLLRVIPGFPELTLCLGLYPAGNRTSQCKVKSVNKHRERVQRSLSKDERARSGSLRLNTPPHSGIDAHCPLCLSTRLSHRPQGHRSHDLELWP